jgi:hypothetical protein
MILRDSYDLTKIMKIAPSEVQRMSITKKRMYMKWLNEDIQKKDIFIVPKPMIGL